MPALTKRGRTVAFLLASSMLAAPMVAAPFFHSTPAEARGAQLTSYADLVEAAKPAVVTVLTETSAPTAMTGFPGDEGPFGDFFRKFFEDRGGQMPGQPFGRGQQPQQPQQPERRAQALGSGFIIDSDGVIVTNRHVVENATKVTVRLDDGTELPATIVGADDKTDIAVLKVDAGESLPTVPWGDSDAIRVGDGVVAIGNPFGLGGTVTAGIISARGRDINSGPYDDYLQVDAAINRGNSGGPLFDEDGEVIGVNTAIISPSGGNIGLGFAIPSDQAKKVVAAILDQGYVERGKIAVSIQSVTPDIAAGLGLDEAKGALVAQVIDGGPAAKAGVKTGDVIVGFNGKKIDEVRDLTRDVAATAPGTEATLTVWRDGSEKQLSIEVAAMEHAETAALAPAQQESASAQLAVANLGVDISDAPQGGAVVVSVDPSKSAAQSGLRPGDRITAVNQTEVASAADVDTAISKAQSSGRKAVVLQIQRNDASIFVGVPFGDA